LQYHSQLFCLYCKQPTHASPGDDDALPPYQEDLLTQYGVDPVAASQGHWSPYSVSTTPTGKTWTRTFTAPDGTVITEVSSSGHHWDGLWPSFLVAVIFYSGRYCHGLWPSLSILWPLLSWFVALIVVAVIVYLVAVIVMVCGHHFLWPSFSTVAIIFMVCGHHFIQWPSFYTVAVIFMVCGHHFLWPSFFMAVIAVALLRVVFSSLKWSSQVKQNC